MTWKFIYTYRVRCKREPAHNRCCNWSPFTSKHTWMRFSKLWNIFPKVSKLKAWISWRIASLSCSIVRGVFNRPQRKKSAGVRSASTCLELFDLFLDATLRWCTSFTKFRSKCRLACFKWTCLPVYTNEKPALFDCMHRQQFGASSEILTLYIHTYVRTYIHTHTQSAREHRINVQINYIHVFYT